MKGSAETHTKIYDWKFKILNFKIILIIVTLFVVNNVKVDIITIVFCHKIT